MDLKTVLIVERSTALKEKLWPVFNNSGFSIIKSIDQLDTIDKLRHNQVDMLVAGVDVHDIF